MAIPHCSKHKNAETVFLFLAFRWDVVTSGSTFLDTVSGSQNVKKTKLCKWSDFRIYKL